MGKLILITGGARSGKSRFAEKLVSNVGKDILYIATSIPFDEEMKDRIKKHREQRPSWWKTLEAYENLDEKIMSIYEGQKGMLLDCITVMINNILFDTPNVDWNTCSMKEVDVMEERVSCEIDKIIKVVNKLDVIFVAVTNEVGLGIVPENRLARIYRDIVGRMNQKIALIANKVYFVASGIPIKIK